MVDFLRVVPSRRTKTMRKPTTVRPSTFVSLKTKPSQIRCFCSFPFGGRECFRIHRTSPTATDPCPEKAQRTNTRTDRVPSDGGSPDILWCGMRKANRSLSNDTTERSRRRYSHFLEQLRLHTLQLRLHFLHNITTKTMLCLSR